MIEGEGSKGDGSPVELQGRLAQLEECFVCNEDAGGSNPPTSISPQIFALNLGEITELVDFLTILNQKYTIDEYHLVLELTSLIFPIPCPMLIPVM